MEYKILFEKSAVKELSRIDHTYQTLIKEKILQLSKDFDSLKNNLKILKGKRDYYRLAVGSYRVVFTKDDDKIIITIIRIGHRKNVFGNL